MYRSCNAIFNIRVKKDKEHKQRRVSPTGGKPTAGTDHKILIGWLVPRDCIVLYVIVN